MKAAVLSQGSLSSKWTIDAMKEYFDEVDDLNIKHMEINFSGNKAQILYKGEPLPRYDCIFSKGSFRYANLLKTFTILINGDSYMPIGPDAFTIAHDKLLTQLELQKANIPMPTTYMASTIGAARTILERLHYPIIMKFPQGTQGKGVLFAESFASASSILDALSYLRQPFLIQEYIETGGTDVRAFVVGDKVVAAYQRRASVKEKRANIHAGGQGEMIDLDDATIRLAIKAAKAVGASICGVDILIGHKGPVVIEINSSPGLQGVTKYTGVNVAQKIAKYLFDQTTKFKSEHHGKKAEKILSTIENVDKEQQLITSPDFRGSRILLPEVISRIASLKEDDDYEFTARKGEITIKKFKI
ncbi:MAG: RimK family alpha-L-glutamate ligase [Nanoarchaeota archaeon]|nr:RimK family alpha-L-glutamate ligase [Nanoarchaeota archaeon]